MGTCFQLYKIPLMSLSLTPYVEQCSELATLTHRRATWFVRTCQRPALTWFTVCFKSDKLQFLNILSANKVATLSTVHLLYLLNCIIEII